MVKIVKILLVEEKHDFASILKKILEAKNHHVVWANQCKNAIELVAKTKFDVVIIDIQRDECSNYCVIHELEKNGRIGNETKVIALFVKMTSDEKKEWENKGVSFCFAMPVTPEVLIESIDSFSQ